MDGMDLSPQEIRKAFDHHGFSDATNFGLVHYLSSAVVRGPGMYMLFTYGVGDVLPGSDRRATTEDTNLEESLCSVTQSQLVMDTRVEAWELGGGGEESPELGVLSFVYHPDTGPDYAFPVLGDAASALRADPGDRIGAWVVQREPCAAYLVRVTLCVMVPGAASSL